MGLFKKRWNPYVAGIMIGVIQVPLFMFLDMTANIVWYYPVLDHPFHQQVNDIINEAVPLTSDKRFLWHKVWLVMMVLGVLLSVWAGGMRVKIPPIIRSFKGIMRLAIYCIIGFIGGFMMFFGSSLIVLERFDFWQLFSGISSLSLSSYLVVASILVGGMVMARIIARRML